MKKRTFAILTAALLSCLNIGDRAPMAAPPLEVASSIRIPGPVFVVERPLELSLDERLDVQEIVWEYQMLQTMRRHGRTHRSTDSTSLSQNPLPAVSAFLGDAYRALQQ